MKLSPEIWQKNRSHFLFSSFPFHNLGQMEKICILTIETKRFLRRRLNGISALYRFKDTTPFQSTGIDDNQI